MSRPKTGNEEGTTTNKSEGWGEEEERSPGYDHEKMCSSPFLSHPKRGGLEEPANEKGICAIETRTKRPKS